MKTAAELVSILQEAAWRHEGFAWAAVRPTDLSALSVLVQDLQAQLAAAEARACHCEAGPAFDLVAHERTPSRENPLLAAAAVNILKAATVSKIGA